jgi:tetratricopeptide (TPR) repeat protein
LLGTPRSLHERAEAEKKIDQPAVPEEAAPPLEPRERHEATAQEKIAEEAAQPEPESSAPGIEQRTVLRKADDKSGRAIEMQHAALIIGALLVLGLTFYVGRKFDYWRFLVTAKNSPKLPAQFADKFPNVSAEELVEQALAAEHGSNLRDAIDRFVAAKHKNLKYRGILFRIGKIAYDHGDFDAADKLFERAIAFNENVDTSNYFRGLIATRHRDLPAALRFFEAAANADPFTADYYYYWAEALRLDHHPQDAVTRYTQAERRARNEQDKAVCQFKERMARLEAGEAAQLKSEIDKKGSAGALSVDWLMTAAAVAIREGRIDDAARFARDAHAFSLQVVNGMGIYVSCTGDPVFRDACEKHSELAEVCQENLSPRTATP